MSQANAWQMYSAHVSDLIRHIVQIGMVHGLTCCDTISWIASEHFVKQVETLFVQVGHERVQWARLALLQICHVLFVKGQLGVPRPFIECRCTSDLEDFV